MITALFFSEHFVEYCAKFPDEKLATNCSSFTGIFDKERLKTKLFVIYSRKNCRDLNGALPFLKFVVQNNLDSTLKEVKKMLELITINVVFQH